MGYPMSETSPDTIRIFVSGIILISAGISAGIGVKLITDNKPKDNISSTICNLTSKYIVKGIDISGLEKVFEDVGNMTNVETMDQWRRDRHRLTFTNTTCNYIETHMAWCIRYVSQTLPNGIWCELHRINSVNPYLHLIGKQVMFTSNHINGFKIIRLTDTHIRCLIIFNIQDLDQSNMTINENNSVGSYICITYDIVYIDDWTNIMDGDRDGDQSNAYILLIDCSIGNKSIE